MVSNKTDLCVGDSVRVVQAGGGIGDTSYEIVEMNYEVTGYRCMIREINPFNPSVKYQPHEVDVSMLKREET